jgi:hypothetical protein
VRYSQIEDRIAEKFEPLVVIGGKTAMRQCLLQESRVRKRMLKARLQRGKATFGHDTIDAADPASLEVRFI